MANDSGTTVPVGTSPETKSLVPATPVVTTPAVADPATTTVVTPAVTVQQPAIDPTTGLPVVGAPVNSNPLSLDADAPTVAAPVIGSQTGKVITYDPTGNPKLDMSLSFLGKLGLGPDHPGMKAAANGDFSILKATLATMGDTARGWEANVQLGESAYTDMTTERTNKAVTDRKSMMDAVGGEAVWNQVKAYASAATADSPTERAAVNSALARGGIEGKAMAVYLHSLYSQSTTVTQEPAAAISRSGGSQAAASQPAIRTDYALSPRQYTDAVAKLNSTLRGRLDGSPEYAELKQRRSAWRDPRG